jgi:hypothetical protein
MVWIKEGAEYAKRFHKNCLVANPKYLAKLFKKYESGTLDMRNKYERMFHQFMMNGGETGYVNLRDITAKKSAIKKELDKANGKISAKRAFELLGEKLDLANRAVENCARFAAFITSREIGRTMDRSIYDAKEISVNFNKKGSGGRFAGANGQTGVGKISALMAGFSLMFYVFFNASVQGLTNFSRQAKRHPKKALSLMATIFMLGAAAAFFGDDDDDDETDKNAYYNIPEHVRRTHLMFRIGSHWISYPLPIEYRAIYGMGELTTSLIMGNERNKTPLEIAKSVAAQLTQILPLDLLQGEGGFSTLVPSGVKPISEAFITNKSWTGLPIYKDNDFNKHMPNWTKAYSNTNTYLVNLAATLNDVSGGNDYKKGLIDINPARIEHLLEGYLGGYFSTADKMVKTAEMIFSDREYDPRNVLLLNRVVKAGDERTEARAVNNEYFEMKDRYEELKSQWNSYRDDTRRGKKDFMPEIDEIRESGELRRMRIFDKRNKRVKELNDRIKNTTDEERKKELNKMLDDAKADLVNAVNETRES